jgi:cob(I)alamin adenosyltransferase
MMTNDKPADALALLQKRFDSEMEGVASFASSVEDQVDSLESMIKEVAQASLLLDQMVMHSTGLAQENAVVIRSVIHRFERKFLQQERRIAALERRL